METKRILDWKGHCDLRTGKVYGCRRGSKKWYHEKGHFIFNNDDNFSFLITIRDYLQQWWLFFMMLAFFYRPFIISSVSFWVMYFLIFIFEEVWCMNYANKKYKGKF